MEHWARKYLGIALFAALILILLPGALSTAKAEEYPLWIGGVHVTSENPSGTGWSFTPKTDSTQNTLALNGYSYTGKGMEWKPNQNSDEAFYAAILYNSEDPLVINLEGSSNILSSDSTNLRGIMSLHADVTVEGSGSLSISVENASSSVGIDVYSSLTVNSGTLTVTGGEATSGQSYGIKADTVTVNGGKLSATGGKSSSFGQSYGISAGTVMISENGKLTASGSTKAISGTVKNDIAGSGWSALNSDYEGTHIDINTNGQTYNYKLRLPT